ncbi:hypothetical protein [Roseimaritima ulvae]|uniref:Aminotransferase class V domain-containing protein n=1 Tax=Roseimaritima ulvae TaxID=980254 RepID=A0A5B9R875_9BACT|nr:hypothetical protein [Roseimaritima ulvae]QEG42991.1 hypothetical protein UC8_50340 [Roseimaritima ulvae]
MTSVVAMLRFLWLHLCSHRALVNRLRKRVDTDSLVFTPTFSGRTAILQLAQQLRQNTDRRKAYVPDYICNVVERALREAGFETVSYATDENFNPDRKALDLAIADPHAAIMVFASIYGSAGGLDVLNEASVRRRLLASGVHVLLDICQDVTLRHRIPSGFASQLSAVLSFNDKSFPGAMGGGILSPQPLNFSSPSPSLRESGCLYYYYGRKASRALVRSLFRSSRDAQVQPPRTFEYSTCERFPFDLVARQPSKLQLVLAVLGMDAVDRLVQQRTRLADSDLAVRELPFRTSSPYLIIDSAPGTLPNRVKPPYAVFHDRVTSLRPNLIVMHNKGFDDV